MDHTWWRSDLVDWSGTANQRTTIATRLRQVDRLLAFIGRFTSADDTEQPGGLGRPRPRSRNNMSLLASHGVSMDDWTSVKCELLLPSLDHGLGFRSQKPLFLSLAGGTSPMNLNLLYP